MAMESFWSQTEENDIAVNDLFALADLIGNLFVLTVVQQFQSLLRSRYGLIEITICRL